MGIARQDSEEDLRHDPPADRAEMLAVVELLRLGKDVVPQRGFYFQTPLNDLDMFDLLFSSNSLGTSPIPESGTRPDRQSRKFRLHYP